MNILCPVHTLHFTYAELDANEVTLLFSLIRISQALVKQTLQFFGENLLSQDLVRSFLKNNGIEYRQISLVDSTDSN